MLGFHFDENFNYPYMANSITDFWRRWHISLSTWFKEYVYIPLGGNRKGKIRTYLNTMIIFLLSGLWHGADWTFVCWGAFHGICYMAEMLIQRGKGQQTAIWRHMLHIAVTFWVVTLAWVLFRAESMAQAVTMYRAMLHPWQMQAAWDTMAMTWPQVFMLIVSVTAAWRLERWAFADRAELPQTWSVTVGVIVLIGIALCWLARLDAGLQNTFIYFQF